MARFCVNSLCLEKAVSVNTAFLMELSTIGEVIFFQNRAVVLNCFKENRQPYKNKKLKVFTMQCQSLDAANASAATLSKLTELMDKHHQAIGDNVSYFSDLVLNDFSVDASNLSDIFAQLDKLYLDNMSKQHKEGLISAFAQIDSVIYGSHSLSCKSVQIDQIHDKVDQIVTSIVASFDFASQQRLKFLSEHLN